MSYRKSSMLSLLVAVLCLCGVNAFANGSHEKSATSTGQHMTLTYMSWEDASWQQFGRAFNAQYMKEHPNITIDYQPTAGSDFETKLLTYIAGGTPPDVTWVQDWRNLYPKGVFAPLEPYMKKYGVKVSQYNPDLVKMASYNGKLYGLFGWNNIGLIYYNKKLIQDAGLALPKSNWTWAEFKQIAEKVTHGSGANKVYGVDMPLNWDGPIDNFMWSTGGGLVNSQGNYDGAMNSPQSAKALAWYTSFVKEGLSPDITSLNAMGGEVQAFVAGRIAMIYWFPQLIYQIKHQYTSFGMDNLGYDSVPVLNAGDKPNIYDVYTNPISIPEAGKHKDAAFQYLEARVSRKTQIAFCNAGWGLPSIPSLLPEISLFKQPIYSSMIAMYTKRQDYNYPTPAYGFTPVYTLLTSALYNAVNNVVVNNESPQKALDGAVAEIKQKQQG